ncbi:MAG TPA: hypothetical protein VK207_05245 [Bacteroidales bacterium]|nr:hypothetical protein [Bacteroidales bacterium]
MAVGPRIVCFYVKFFPLPTPGEGLGKRPIEAKAGRQANLTGAFFTCNGASYTIVGRIDTPVIQ